MSEPASAHGGILQQLQSDAPQSPLVGHLLNRLSLSDDTALRSSNADTGIVDSPSAIPSTSQCDVSRSGILHAASTIFAKSAMGSERTRVKTHSRKPISGHFLALSPTHSSTISQSRGVAGNADHSGVDAKMSNINSSSVRPESFVLVHNVAKRHNLGTLARSAAAFGVSEVILVGRKDFNAFGSHGASLHIQFRHFHTLPEAALYLKAKDVDICGVEIVDGAIAVHKHPFTRSTAFLLGNEGTGLSKKEMEICSFFVYIPQCGSGTASLNVTVAASIVLHHFSVWAGFAERQREGQKFLVAERPMRRTPRNIVVDLDEVRERRLKKADYGSDDWFLCDAFDEKELDEATEGTEAFKLEFPTNKRH